MNDGKHNHFKPNHEMIHYVLAHLNDFGRVAPLGFRVPISANDHGIVFQIDLRPVFTTPKNKILDFLDLTNSSNFHVFFSEMPKIKQFTQT